jgi:hypothetical protein
MLENTGMMLRVRARERENKDQEMGKAHMSFFLYEEKCNTLECGGSYIVFKYIFVIRVSLIMAPVRQ